MEKMNKSTYHVTKMDCSAEEQLVRMRLDGFPTIERLEFDLPNRILAVYHTGDAEPITEAVNSLSLGSTFKGSELANLPMGENTTKQRQLLITVLVINFVLFIVEMTTGLISHSMGLVADSLDMLADALVYGLSVYAVGKAVAVKKKIAKASGYFQLVLAVACFAEVIRRFFGYSETPVFQTMIIISCVALLGNAISLYLLNKQKSDEAHMKASWIFTTNDIIVNLGVITAGVLVYFLNSTYPDLIIGAIVFIVVARGALRILKL